MSVTWSEFAGNLAFVGLAIATWAHVSIWFSRQLADRERIAFGFSAGLTAIGSILLAVEAAPGLFIDLRHAPVALAGMFGGPIAAATAASITMAARLWIGGAGAIEGVLSIALVAGLATGVHAMTRRRQPRLSDVLVLTAGLGLLLVSILATLPTLGGADLLRKIGLPFVGLNCAATFVGGVILFMTRRTQLERSVLESAFAQSPDFIYVKDRSSRFLTVNDNMATLYHVEKPADLIGRTDFDVMPRSVAGQLFQAEQDMMESGRPILDSFENIDGRFLLASKVPLRDPEGRILGLAGVTRDITERTQLENELRESKNMLAHAMASMSDGLAMFDRDGRLVFCNEQYRLAFPLSADVRVPGAHISDILRRVVETRERADGPGGAGEAWIREAARALHVNKDEEVELANGNWLSIRTRVDEEGAAMVVVCDITATKHAEAALRAAAEQLKSLAETDGLTGITNRRAFDEIFGKEAARCAVEGVPLSLLIMDLDWFKAYNDTYGHPSGDECLRKVVRRLLECVKRLGDVAARYGGEEFVILLPGTDIDGARALAGRIKDGIGDLGIAHSASQFGRVTVSIGVATAEGGALLAGYHRLLSAADRALYHAKAQGRNSVAEASLDDVGDGRLVG